MSAHESAWRRAGRGMLSLVVAAGLAAGAAVFATDWLHDHRAAQVAAQQQWDSPEKRVDRVVHALEGVADDGVYVAPDARGMLDAKGERKVARAVAASSTPVKVVVWSRTRFAGADGYELIQQLEAGLAESGDSGVYLVWSGPEQGDANTFGASGYLRDLSPHESFVGDPALTLPRLVKQVDEAVHWTTPASGDDFDYWGGRGGGIAAGLLIGSGVLLGVGLLYGVAVMITKRRLPGRWKW